MKRVLFIILSIVLVFSLVACNTTKEPEVNPNDNPNKQEENVNNKYKDVTQNPVVTMTMENGDVVKIELYPQIAPQTVENFVSLVKSGFYDGLTFHRVIPGFMAQGGDPEGNGTGGASYEIFGEFKENGFTNELSHDVGVISMARAQDYNSASSQFFIVTDAQAKSSLDGLYAGFGKVIEGMDAVYTIVNADVIRKDYSDDFYNAYVQAGQQLEVGTDLYEQYIKETMEIDKPVTPPVIKTMTVETFGIEYDEPTKY